MNWFGNLADVKNCHAVTAACHRGFQVSVYSEAYGVFVELGQDPSVAMLNAVALRAPARQKNRKTMY